MAKSGIRKGKDFVKNMEKLKKIYGGKIPKNLTLEEADKTLKKVTPIKKKSGGKVGRATTGDRSVQRRKKRTKQATESLKKVRDLAKRAKPMSQFVSQPEAVKMLKKNMKKSGGEDRLTQKNLEELRSIMKKKSGGTAKKNKKKDPIVSKFKRVRDTILLAPEAVEIGKDILQNLPMSKGGMKKLKPIPADNKGLPKLPKAVRNRMGYMKKGGSIKAPCKLGRNKPTKLL
jgi:hypothetical protein